MEDNKKTILLVENEAFIDLGPGISGPDSFWDGAYKDPERMYWEHVPITRRGEETSYISASATPIPGESKRGRELFNSTVVDLTSPSGKVFEP